MDGLKVYRNEKGIFLHKNYNIVIKRALFADNNRAAVDIDRATGIAIRDTRIVGISDAFRKVLKTHNVLPPCYRRKTVGIDLHTWKLDKRHNGIDLADISFEGFDGTICEPRVIDVDEHVSRIICCAIATVLIELGLTRCSLSSTDTKTRSV